MNQKVDSSYQEAMPPLPFWETVWQLPMQYIRVMSRPSVEILSEEMNKASWGTALTQFLGLVIITVGLGLLAHVLPSSAFHSVGAFSIGSVSLSDLLPSPLDRIMLVLASFLIGLGTAYLFSRLCGGQGTFLKHLYCLLLCTVPLVTISGVLLLIPATGSLALVVGGIVSLLFIYRTVLHVFTIMAVHGIGAGRATLIVLIFPMLILIVIMSLMSEGEFLVTLLDFFLWGRDKRRKAQR